VSKVGKSQGGQAVPAGVFTQPFATQLVILALEEAIERGVLKPDGVTQNRLEQFLSRAGRRFYKLPSPDDDSSDAAIKGGSKIVLERKGETIPPSIKSGDGTLEIGLSKSTAEVFSLGWLT
jgi:dihydroorotase